MSVELYFIIVGLIAFVLYSFFKGKSTAKVKNSMINDWEVKVQTARLSEGQYRKATEEEKVDLIYYCTQRIRKENNYSRESVTNMPKPLRVVYHVNELEMEVNNGGFLQFFVNSSGIFAEETVEALDLIGANHTKLLLEQALQIIEKYAENHESLRGRINTLKMHEIFKMSDLEFNEEMEEELKKLDYKFYTDKDPLDKLKIEYFDKNQAEVWAAIDK